MTDTKDIGGVEYPERQSVPHVATIYDSSCTVKHGDEVIYENDRFKLETIEEGRTIAIVNGEDNAQRIKTLWNGWAGVSPELLKYGTDPGTDRPLGDELIAWVEWMEWQGTRTIKDYAGFGPDAHTRSVRLKACPNCDRLKPGSNHRLRNRTLETGHMDGCALKRTLDRLREDTPDPRNDDQKG